MTEKEYEQHLNKSVKQAEGAMHNVFHCKTPDCPGFCQFEDNVNEFHCDVCGKVNCLTCQVIVGDVKKYASVKIFFEEPTTSNYLNNLLLKRQ